MIFLFSLRNIFLNFTELIETFYTFQIDGWKFTNASNRRDKLRNMEADEFEENRDWFNRTFTWKTQYAAFFMFYVCKLWITILEFNCIMGDFLWP